jgi:hypothetical protein
MRLLILRQTVDGVDVSLVEPDDARRLNVETDLTDLAQVSFALERSGAGRLEEDAAWLDIAYLHRTATPVDRASWEPSFDAMIEYAGTHGWLSADARRVRAHVVVRTPAE